MIEEPDDFRAEVAELENFARMLAALRDAEPVGSVLWEGAQSGARACLAEARRIKEQCRF